MILMLSLILLCCGFIIGNNLGIAQGRLELKPLPPTIRVEILDPREQKEIPTVHAEVIDAEYIEIPKIEKPEIKFKRLVDKAAHAAYTREERQCSASRPRRLSFYA